MNKKSDFERTRESSLGFLLNLLSRRFDRDMKQQLAEVDIDLKTFANLMLLSENDGITQRELGKLLEFPDYFTSRKIDELVKLQYVERKPDPSSRRSILIYLTSKGRKKAKELPAIVRSVNEKHMELLSYNERKQLIGLLSKITEI